MKYTILKAKSGVEVKSEGKVVLKAKSVDEAKDKLRKLIRGE